MKITSIHKKKKKTLFFFYQLRHVVDDDQVRPCVGRIKIAFMVHAAQLTDPGEEDWPSLFMYTTQTSKVINVKGAYVQSNHGCDRSYNCVLQHS